MFVVFTTNLSVVADVRLVKEQLDHALLICSLLLSTDLFKPK